MPTPLTPDQVLTPPADNRGARPTWLDDPELTKIDYTELAKLGQTVQEGMAQQMVQRGADTLEEQFAHQVSTGQPTADQAPTHPITKEPTQAAIDADALAAAQGQGTSAPAGDSGVSPAGVPGDATQSSSDPSLITVTLGTNPDGTPQTTTITQAQALQALYTQQWFDAQPQQVKQQWAAIQQGQAQAIPLSEYQQLVAQAQQAQALAAQQQYAQQLAQRPALPTRPDLTYADPETIAHIEALTRIAQQAQRQDLTPGQLPPAPSIFPGQPSVPPVPAGQGSSPYSPSYPPTQSSNPTYQATIDIEGELRKRQQLDTTTSAIQTKYGLSDTQVQRLQERTVQQQMVARLSQEQSIRDPFGNVLQQPDFGHVLNQAYEAVMATDPYFRPVYEDAIVASRLASGQQITATTQAKKALAGSLASAAPAAVPSAPQNPATMTHDQTVRGISAFLAEAQANGTFGN